MPLSHDEMVHLKGSLYEKMPGDHWQKLANLRRCSPTVDAAGQVAAVHGKRDRRAVTSGTTTSRCDWHLAEHPDRAAFMRVHGAARPDVQAGARRSGNWTREPRGFEWIDVNDRANSVLSYMRRSDDGACDRRAEPHAQRRTARIASACRSRASTRALLSSDAREWGGSGYAPSCSPCMPTTFRITAGAIRSSSRLPPLSARSSCRRGACATGGTLERMEEASEPTVRSCAACRAGSASSTRMSTRRASPCATRRTTRASGCSPRWGTTSSTEDGARKALRALRRRKRREWIAPVRVVRQRSKSLATVRVRVPRTLRRRGRVALDARDRRRRRLAGSGAARRAVARRGAWRSSCPSTRRSAITISTSSFSADGQRRRTPRSGSSSCRQRCTPPELRLHGKRGFGITTNLYTVRSNENWGAGDIGDVADDGAVARAAWRRVRGNESAACAAQLRATT